MGTAGVMRALGALTLTLAMLTAGEAAGLADQRLGPKERSIIASIGDNRPVILARATYATYTNVIGGSQTIMSVTIPPNTLAPGDMLRVAVGGTYQTTAGADVIGATVAITQGGTRQFFQLPARTAASPNLIAWRTEGLIGVSVAGANGQYLPTMSASQPTGVTPPSRLINSAIAFAGYVDTLISVNDGGASFFRGGFLQTTVPATTGSAIGATFTQLVFENSQPMLIEVIVGSVAAPTQFLTVQAGVLEGL